MDGRTGEHKLRKENKMTLLFSRILEKKKESGKTWDEIAKEAHIKLGSWMTGLPTSKPSDEDLRKMAPVLNTTYEYLKNGK
jgi:transcriptional regulator with XRE-family HTH domain